MPWNSLERAAAVTALREAGPGAPTLCEGWRSEQLAAHLVLRESNPLVGLGVVLPPLAGRAERTIQEVGARAAGGEAWKQLLGRVATGPPVWHPLHWGGDAAQLVEYFVHTEDVRRGGPDGRDVPARPRSVEHDDALWNQLRRMTTLLLRRSPAPLVLTDGGTRTLRAGPSGPSTPAGDGTQPVVVRGDVGELVLWAYDRARVAHVELEGPPAALVAVESFRRR